MIYIDSNIFIFARADNTKMGDACRLIMERVESGNIPGATSVLAIDEVVWKIRKELGYKEGIDYGKELLDSGMKFLPVQIEDLLKAFGLMETGLKPRDALHAAVCLNHAIFSILTADADFRKVKELKVIGPETFH